MKDENFDTPKTNGTNSSRGAEFERILKEYKKVIQELKKKAIAKYGYKAADLFGM